MLLFDVECGLYEFVIDLLVVFKVYFVVLVLFYDCVVFKCEVVLFVEWYCLVVGIDFDMVGWDVVWDVVLGYVMIDELVMVLCDYYVENLMLVGFEWMLGLFDF